MSTLYCFQCAREYLEDVAECVECGVPLVEEKPTPPELVGEVHETQTAYELYEWSFESRRMLDQLLTGEGVAHGWQGAVLIVREADEDRVDGLVEQAEASEGPVLDPDADHVGYAMDDWSAEAQSLLSEALGLAGIPHLFDEDGELVVSEDHEDQVDEIVETITARVAIEDELGEASTIMEGLELNDFLGEVRSLGSRLARNPGDAKSTLALVRQARRLADVRTPFGFDSRRWAAIRKAGADMAGVLSDEDRTEDDVVGAANALSGLLADVI